MSEVGPAPPMAGVLRGNAAADAGLAVLAFAVTVGVLAADGFGTPDAGVHHLDALGVLLAAASTLPLAARRRAPLAVGLATIVTSAAMYRFGYPLDMPLGPGVAIYTIGVMYGGDPRPLRRRTALAVALAFAPAMAVAYALRGADVGAILLPELAGVALVSAMLCLSGDRARLRRERMAALEERARRAEQLAVAEERTRIARELHDSAGHAINVILVQAGAARLLHERDPEGSRRAIATVEEVARGTIGEIDRLVRALRDAEPVPPVPAGAEALSELVDQHRAGGLAVAAVLPPPGHALPNGVAWAAYRILQEALTNAARHGRGSADVAVSFAPDAVDITVTNPTAGPRPAPGGGHGIVGMRERALLLDGTLTTAADRGVFRLHARLPLGRTA